MVLMGTRNTGKRFLFSDHTSQVLLFFLTKFDTRERIRITAVSFLVTDGFFEQPPEVFCKKVFVRNPQENTYARVSLLIKLQARNTIFYRTPPDDCFYLSDKFHRIKKLYHFNSKEFFKSW